MQNCKMVSGHERAEITFLVKPDFGENRVFPYRTGYIN